MEEIAVKKEKEKKISSVILQCKPSTEAFWDR